MKRLTLALALFCVSFSFLAADGGTAVIVYAEGNDISVIRDRREMKVDEALGFVIQAGDIVQTGKNTVIELSVKPKKAVIRVSGNTTLQFRGSYQTGETSLAVLYGRVRAKVEKLIGAERFTLRNEGTVAGVRGTDFGMDVVVSKASELGESKVNVYSFEGELSVETALNASSAVQASSLIKTGEMAEVVVKDQTVSLVTTKVADEVQEYWTANAFKSEDASSIVQTQVLAEAEEPVQTDALQAEGTEIVPSVPVAAAIEAPRMDWSAQKKTLGLKNGMLGTSAVLVAAGAGLGIYGAYRKGTLTNDSYSDTLLLVAGLSSTTGFMCGLFGFLLNPSIPAR
jgi:hypothetical protein